MVCMIMHRVYCLSLFDFNLTQTAPLICLLGLCNTLGILINNNDELTPGDIIGLNRPLPATHCSVTRILKGHASTDNVQMASQD